MDIAVSQVVVDKPLLHKFALPPKGLIVRGSGPEAIILVSSRGPVEHADLIRQIVEEAVTDAFKLTNNKPGEPTAVLVKLIAIAHKYQPTEVRLTLDYMAKLLNSVAEHVDKL